MRAIIMAALVSAALPTSAQQLDTRRIDIAEARLEHGIPGYRCSFAALPGLTLQHTTEHGWAQAAWSRPADGHKDDDARLVIGYRQLPGASFGASPAAIFFLGQASGTFTRSDKTARLSLDGRVIEAAVAVQQDRTGKIFAITWPSASGYPSKDALPHGRTLTLDLLDAKGTPVASYRWDIQHVDEIPDLLDRVQWSCLTPDKA